MKWPLVVVALVAIMSGCRGGDLRLPSDSCALVTRQEVADAVGFPVVRVSRVASRLVPEKETICDYATESPFGTVVVYSSRAGGVPTDMADRYRREAKQGSVLIEGIGDARLSYPNGITVLIGPDYFTVGTQYVHQGADLVVRSLARSVVRRLEER